MIDRDLEPYRLLFETLLRREGQLSTMVANLRSYMNELLDELAKTSADRSELESALLSYLEDT